MKKRYILFGAGIDGVNAMNFIGKDNIICFCDNKKAGQLIDQIPIIHPHLIHDFLDGNNSVEVIVTVRDIAKYKEIRDQLENLGVSCSTFDMFRIDYIDNRLKNKKITALNFDFITKSTCDGMCYEYLKSEAQKSNALSNDYTNTRIHSENVWWCWLQGIENAPDICKACLDSVKMTLEPYDYNLNILDKNSIFDYINLPGYIMDKYQKGKISSAHFSDLIRLELLVNHGGTWIDSTVYITQYQKVFFDEPLFYFSNTYFYDFQPLLLSNWLLTSDIANPVLRLTRKLLHSYWKVHEYALNYFIFHLYFRMALESYPKIWEKVPVFPAASSFVLARDIYKPFSNERFEQIKRISDVHKLSYRYKVNNKSDTFLTHLLDSHKIR